jgi:hypothetical protein
MTKSLMKQLLAVLLLSCLISLVPVRVNAWGPSGHRIVALIAVRHLTPQARAGVQSLLGNTNLAAVANFADFVRDLRPETSRWHFADIPSNAAAFDPARDCRLIPNRGDCAVAAIERFRAVLADTSAPQARRAEALKFLVHLVGDIHQPLHCGDPANLGGNTIAVKFFGRSTNLHRLWDSGIIAQAGISDQEFADELEQSLAPSEIEALQVGTPVDWANESHALAVSNAYKIPPSKRLGMAYYDKNSPVVDDRLLQAGLRLARILNEAFA